MMPHGGPRRGHHEGEQQVGPMAEHDPILPLKPSRLLRLFVVEDPTNEEYAGSNNYQSNNDTRRRPHFFDQVENHSHVLIPFLLAC